MLTVSVRARRATIADKDAVTALTREAYAEWVPVIGREPRPMTADYAFALTSHWIDVYENGPLILGLIEMVPADGHLVIENLAVAKAAQGTGLGSRLLVHAEETARSNQFAEIRLYTNAAFTRNLAFYTRRGYRETARVPLPDGGQMVHFGKAVS